MEPAASPSPSPNCGGDSGQKSQLARIELFVFLTFFILLSLFPVAIFRRRRKSTALKVYALLANAAILSLIPYTFGVMRSLGHKNDLVSIWAVLFMYVYVNVPNFVSFNDSMSLGVGYVKLILYSYYLTVIMYSSYPKAMSESRKHFIPPRGLPRLVNVILVLTTIRAYQIINCRALLMYSKGGHLGSRIRGTGLPPQTFSSDPWLSCKYAVYHDDDNYYYDDDHLGFTVEEIWRFGEAPECISSSSWELVKSNCLSLSLLWKIVPVFAGRRSYQSSSDQEEAWNLVRKGLLDKAICGNRCPFRVIEVELELLHDYIYNSSCFCLYNFGLLPTLAIHLARLVMIFWAGVFTLRWYQPKGKTQVGGDVLLTRIVVISSIFLELVQLIEFFSSRWQKTKLIYIYYSSTRKSPENQCVWDRCIRKATEKVFSPKRGCELKFKPWRQLGQYSLLDTYSYLQRWRKPLNLLNVMTGNRFVSSGRKQSKSVSLTNEIKEAVINTLLDRSPQLTNGLATFRASDQLSPETKSKLVWACTQLHTKAEVVLIWHIATSMCELKQEGPPPDSGDFNVATSLSKYCAYLVAFAPDMLPGNVANSNVTCSVVIKEAYTWLMKCEASIIFDKLKEKIIADDDSDQTSERGASGILKQGAVLGEVLVEQVEDPKARWKVLAGFWAEMILYLAPNDNNEWAHVERLADGGEFITHLWALLYHAGFVDRDSLSNHLARDANANHPSGLGQV